MELTSENVSMIFMDCLFREEEISGGETPEGAVIVDGVVRKFGLHPGRLLGHMDEVLELLGQLPAEFHKDSGGGMSFLNACVRADGKQWTGQHRVMEQLFCLGLGIGAVTCLMPRDLWAIMPGHVPYYMVDVNLPQKGA